MMRLAALLVLACAAGSPAGKTCNIPVFRYALERWPAAPYRVVVFHRGPLEGDSRDAVEELRRQSANVEPDHVNLAEPISPSLAALDSKTRKGGPLPWMVALYPGTEDVAWAGPASGGAAKLLVDSPVRREVVRRVLSGDTAVWILLESGDAEKDDRAIKLLETELRSLEKTLKIPEHGPGDPPLLADIPVKLAFSTVRLSRGDAAEKALVDMLLPHDAELKGPAVFPVFGRGRSLGAVFGAQLDAPTIRAAAEFLTGACACEVKEENPGVDLLVARDWEEALALAHVEEAPPVPAPQIPTRPAGPCIPVPPEPDPPASEPRPLLWIGLAGAAALVAITGARLFRRT